MKSIRTKILAITVSLLLLSLSVVTATFGILSARSSTNTVRTILQETTKTASIALENRLTASKSILNEIGTISALTDSESTVAHKRQRLNSKIEKYGLVDCGMLDIQGRSLTGTNMSGEEFYQHAIKGETYVGSPVENAEGTATTITFSAPLWKDGMYNTQIVGAVYCVVDGTFLTNITNNIKVGNTGKAYVINGQGKTIASTDYNRVIDQRNTINESQSDKSLVEMAEIEKLAISGQLSFAEIRFNGIDNFWCVTPVNGTDNWALGVYAEKHEFMAAIYRSIMFCACISVAFLIAAVVSMVIFSNKMTRPIKDMEEIVGQIANGNYDVSVTYTSKDEIGVMADSVRKMISSSKMVIEDSVNVLEKLAAGDFTVETSANYIGIFQRMENSMKLIISSLSETLEAISNSSDQVASGSEQVSSGAQALSQGATEQASAIEELSATIAEISQKVKDTADNAKHATNLSKEAGEGVMKSNQQMGETIAAMNDIAEASNEIGKIIKTIDDIAFQTNILALNAAVEAARAGEAGKGFAVVADEVRNLAGKSAEAAKNTTALIERAIAAINKGTEIVDQTASSMSDVIEKAEMAGNKISEISNASVDQATAIMQVTSGVDQISSVVQTNSATAEESAAASEELSGQANMLEELCKKFKLNSSDRGISYNTDNTESVETKVNSEYTISKSSKY